jgi:PAS domain-containing protein
MPEEFRGIQRVEVGPPGVAGKFRDIMAMYGPLARRIYMNPEALAATGANPEDIFAHELEHEGQRQRSGYLPYLLDTIKAVPQSYDDRWFEQEALKREQQYELERKRREGVIR